MTPHVPCFQLLLGLSAPRLHHKPPAWSPEVGRSPPQLLARRTLTGLRKSFLRDRSVLLERGSAVSDPRLRMEQAFCLGSLANQLLTRVACRAPGSAQHGALPTPTPPSEGRAEGLAGRTPFLLSLEFHSRCQEPESWLCLHLIPAPSWTRLFFVLDPGCRFDWPAASGLCAEGRPRGDLPGPPPPGTSSSQ